MLKPLAIVGAMAVLAAPALSHAATRCRQANQNNEVAGTVVGAIAGGLIGNAVSGHNRGAGTAIGAVGGAVIGNRIAAGSNQPCPDGYYAYDDGAVVSGYESQYQSPTYQGYQSYQQPGAVVYDEHRYDSSPTYSYNQSPTYDQYNRQYSYSQPSYTTQLQTYSYNQPSYSYNQPSYTAQAEGYDRSSQYWQDEYGRTCHWSLSGRRSSGQSWRQVCR